MLIRHQPAEEQEKLSDCEERQEVEWERALRCINRAQETVGHLKCLINGPFFRRVIQSTEACSSSNFHAKAVDTKVDNTTDEKTLKFIYLYLFISRLHIKYFD